MTIRLVCGVWLLFAMIWLGLSDSSVTWSREGQMVLPTCCSYQQQFSVEFTNCTRKPPNDLLTFDDILNVPPHLMTEGYKNRTHLQNVKYRLKKQAPLCPEGSFSVTLDLTRKRDGFDPYFISLTPNGHLQVGVDYYSPREYCINEIQGSHVTFAICKPTCDARRPCIPKCCDLGQAWDFGDSSVPHCGDIPLDNSWQPPFYADRYTQLSRDKQSELVPHYVLHHPASGFCDYGHPFLISLNSLQNGGLGIVFRVLQDGSIVTRLRRRQWANLPLGDYCLDGIRNPFQRQGEIVDKELETVVFYCHKDVEVSESSISKLYGFAMIISSVFLIITLLVFGLLWENYKTNVLRWTLFSYVGSLLLMYVYFILSYFSPDFDSETVTNAPFCRFIGIGMHFSFLMTFCFLFCINFEIWWTVRSFSKPSSIFRGFTRLYSYFGFAVGFPLTIVLIGVILEAVHGSDFDSEVIVPEYGRFTCNLGSREAFWAYMYGPLGFLLIGNTAFFITTVYSMWKIIKAAKADTSVTIQQKQESELLSRFGKLYVIQGVPWIFELLSFAAHEDEFKWYWILFDLINIFQSVAIFVIFVCNRETVYELCEKYSFCQKMFIPFLAADAGRRKNLREDEDSRVSTVVDIPPPSPPKDTLEMK